MKQICPICTTDVRENSRYPDYLCRNCAARVTDADGRAVKYMNTSPGTPNIIESLTASYADGTPYMSQICFVDGVRCHAREAHMGGIVVRPATDGMG